MYILSTLRSRINTSCHQISSIIHNNNNSLVVLVVGDACRSRFRSTRASNGNGNYSNSNPDNPNSNGKHDVLNRVFTKRFDRIDIDTHSQNSTKTRIFSRTKPNTGNKMNNDTTKRIIEERRFRSMVLSFQSSRHVIENAAKLGISRSLFKEYAAAFLNKVQQGEIPEFVTMEKLWDSRNDRDVLHKTLANAFFRYILPNLRERHGKTLLELMEIADLRSPSQWFPKARAMNRKLHLHVGPTNSGKTYNAIQKLSQCSSGAYLAPLRLLAHEVYEKFNESGTDCNLITGEIRKITSPNAPVLSATVEMAPLNKYFDVAVIDEFQMIADEHRGWAWTTALLGLQAKEIHLCGDSAAVELVKKIAASLNEEVIIHEYERLSPLVVAEKSLGKLQDIQKGDCVVTFSRANIYNLKRSIERTTGLRCAVVYGSLPPETRVVQARLFNKSGDDNGNGNGNGNGSTSDSDIDTNVTKPNAEYDVLVASDAVGMGLNLKIRRIIFHSLTKFDGKAMVPLTISQVKQIAGRAGRYGFHSSDADTKHVGTVTTLEQRDMGYLKKCMSADVDPIHLAGLGPTLEQFVVFARTLPKEPIGKILDLFENLARVEGNFFLCNIENQKAIAEAIQEFPMSLEDRYIFMISPFPADAASILVLRNLAKTHSRSRHACISKLTKVPPSIPRNIQELAVWESLNRVVMGYLWLSYRFPASFPYQSVAMELKTVTEMVIEEGLEKLQFLSPARSDRAPGKDDNVMKLLRDMGATGKGKQRVNDVLAELESKKEVDSGPELVKDFLMRVRGRGLFEEVPGTDNTSLY